MIARAHHENWEFFIAHAGPDIAAAEALYELLAVDHKTFLDKRSIAPGADWDEELREAQRNSLVTVLLLSSKSKSAYYLREEIANAITLSRDLTKSHYVVPVYLDKGLEVLYGLRIKHSIEISQVGGFHGIVEELHKLLIDIKQRSIEPASTANEHVDSAKTEDNVNAVTTVPISGLVVVENDRVYDIWKACLNSILHPNSTITRVIPLKLDKESAVLEALAERRHFIMLPLTLRNYNSLRFAEHAHRLDSPTRIILSSSTNASSDALDRLFDSCVPTQEFSVKTIGKALAQSVNRSLTFAEIEKRIEVVLGTATCFTVKAQNYHDMDRPATLKDYQRDRLA